MFRNFWKDQMQIQIGRGEPNSKGGVAQKSGGVRGT